MTATTEDLTAAEPETVELTEDTDAEDNGEPDADDKDNRDRDFTKVRPLHKELADYINANPHFKAAGLGSLSPNQVKAVLYLRADYNNSPEKVAARAAKKAAKDAEAKKYAGLSDEQIKQVKAAQRKADSATRMAERAAAAQAEADELLAKAKAAQAAGEPDLQAEVEAAQNGAETVSESDNDSASKRRRGIGSRPK